LESGVTKYTVKFFCGTDLRHKAEVESSNSLGALAKALDEVGGSWGPGSGFRIEISCS